MKKVRIQDLTPIGVVDLRDGLAVHARGGVRDRYQPVDQIDGVAIDGDALALARAYIRLGLSDVYVADLDAIARRDGRPQACVPRIAGLVPRLWLDSGVTTADDARRAIDAGAARVIVGLETMTSFDALAEISHAIGRDRTVFSLDLRDGTPMTAARELSSSGLALLAARAEEHGAGSIIVLDVARVGMQGGIDLTAMRRARHAAPSVRLYAGGGVRGRDDLIRLAAGGCEGALVATALLDGSLRGPFGPGREPDPSGRQTSDTRQVAD